MVNDSTKQKILNKYLEINSSKIKEIEILIKELNEWFENNYVLSLYNETEMKIYNAWIKDPTSIPAVLGTTDVALPYSSELSTKFDLANIRKYCQSWCIKNDTISIFFCYNTCGFNLSLNQKIIKVENGNYINRLKDENMLDELYAKVEYILTPINIITSEINDIMQTLDLENMSKDLIKNYSPNIYKKVWKN